MFIHLNGFDFEFNSKALSNFIASNKYLKQSSDVSGIHLSDIYYQMVNTGINKQELVDAILNFNINTLIDEGISIDDICKYKFKDKNISFLIDIKSDTFGRFVNSAAEKEEDQVSINISSLDYQTNMKYADLIQLQEFYRHCSEDRILKIFLDCYRNLMKNKLGSCEDYSIFIACSLLLISSQVSVLDVIQYKSFTLDFIKDKLILIIPEKENQNIFELNFQEFS